MLKREEEEEREREEEEEERRKKAELKDGEKALMIGAKPDVASRRRTGRYKKRAPPAIQPMTNRELRPCIGISSGRVASKPPFLEKLGWYDRGAEFRRHQLLRRRLQRPRRTVEQECETETSKGSLDFI
ncbi:hypothetical protein CIHG_00521 [Coccidioides immitis H538.4]|uniref:Uncharacterized protein n=3 Tax=Coccidioides immitis TaxID=5501 RepID=A0A0J8QHR5_COCIT|nr:hypothetical protein CIRG_07336 [Coccidioides immitis RMSCC 2394]KMU71894.1 hypothetical protein CISG_00203 [Coccidioides immitis RMSCC 3703]KMU82739.1 hypothetical protein CIHG_00521 [Coccidioides immitis H538.4]